MSGNGWADGLVAVVTAAGGGMGGEIAHRLAQEGAAVALNDRDEQRLAETAERVAEETKEVITVPGNVTRRADAQRLFDATLERWGRVDVLMNIVGGIKGPVVNPIWQISEEEWEITIGINLRSIFHCTQLAAVEMMKQRSGKIVNIASSSWAGEPAHAHYAAAKAGVVAFTRSVAAQLGEYNINVNAIAPGPTKRQVDVQATTAGTTVRTGSVLDHHVGSLGRTNEPADIANAALFLVSEASRNISGELITVASGFNPHL
ncbi:3-oxoacyl-[acyl-carrier protein] reductase [Pseudonocardia thermophila]|jgi:Dehydrogenases with different specificities (related to short-chain alcohol dehydrogenases)|uniref:3-oxoacyl-[acyl-carrier protein] reductase n=1 Tax=Pseudonocardia thermophila TaxID=1848 RepID=A0A1M6QHD8_PSETH|nr:SDR family oxidoreductase [Pseudonocardia thermophila]SHK19575.1 3-oxoacyl-[acyl-carrier protein] reductase [Pseudonocardia thermophila]